MRAVYGLWEQSWADDAVLRDRARGLYADPARVRVIDHHSPAGTMQALHIVEPSPQRTPVLYQAGSSGRGAGLRRAACRMCVRLRPLGGRLGPRSRGCARKCGPPGGDPRMSWSSPWRRRSSRRAAEAFDRLAEYRSYVDHEGALTLLSGWVGVDYAGYDLDQKIRYIENDAGRAAMANFSGRSFARMDRSRSRRICGDRRHGAGLCGIARDVAEAMQRGSRQPVSTASISPMRCSPRPSPILSICWCRNCRSGASTKPPTRPARCGKSCSAPARAWRRGILPALRQPTPDAGGSASCSLIPPGFAHRRDHRRRFYRCRGRFPSRPHGLAVPAYPGVRAAPGVGFRPRLRHRQSCASDQCHRPAHESAARRQR